MTGYLANKVRVDAKLTGQIKSNHVGTLDSEPMDSVNGRKYIFSRNDLSCRHYQIPVASDHILKATLLRMVDNMNFF